MSARRTVRARFQMQLTALALVVGIVTLAFGAVAQTTPPPGAAPPPPHAAPAAPAAPAPGTDPVAPPPESTAPAEPAPAEPTAPAEPAPMAESPMMEEPPPVPPPPPPESEEPSDDGGSDRSAGPFSRGSIRLTLLVGTGSTITDQYLIIGGGPGYFLLDGLEVGLDYEAWIFGDPVMHRVSPETRYVFHMVPVVKPYVGVFYRHTFVTGGYDDFDHVGARGGIYVVPRGGGLFVGGGAVYERLLDCNDNSLVDCDAVYPEIFVGVSI